MYSLLKLYIVLRQAAPSRVKTIVFLHQTVFEGLTPQDWVYVGLGFRLNTSENIHYIFVPLLIVLASHKVQGAKGSQEKSFFYWSGWRRGVWGGRKVCFQEEKTWSNQKNEKPQDKVINWKGGPWRCWHRYFCSTSYFVQHLKGGEGFLRRSKRRRHLPKIWTEKWKDRQTFRQTDIVVHNKSHFQK